MKTEQFKAEITAIDLEERRYTSPLIEANRLPKVELLTLEAA